MALATEDDVIEQLGRPLTEAEAARVDILLENASDLLIGYLGDCATYDGSGSVIPGPVVRRCALMVSRLFERSVAGGAGGGFTEQVTTGPFTTRFATATSGGDVWLADADKRALRRYRCGGGSGGIDLQADVYAPRDYRVWP